MKEMVVAEPHLLFQFTETAWCSSSSSSSSSSSYPSGRTMTLGSTQPLTKMSTRNISCGVKAAGAQGWQPYHLCVPIVLKSGSLNLPEPTGPVQACIGIALPLVVVVVVVVVVLNSDIR